MRRLLTSVNRFLPKYNKVVVEGFPNTESSAVEIANYVAENYPYPTYFIVAGSLKDNPQHVLSRKVKVIGRESLTYLFTYLTAKYIFFTHGTFLNSFSKRQVVTNVWHGVLYKRVGKLLGMGGIDAPITVGTSDLTKRMFAQAFDVQEESVLHCGYPRNDVLIRSKNQKTYLKSKLGENFTSFSKIIIWLPTYRKSKFHVVDEDGTDVSNPFYINNFDVNAFNTLLEENNTLCIVKPHPMAAIYSDATSLGNLFFINDEWISSRSVTLYELLGCTDVLISDVSSVMIDYLLLDQPVVCISTDIEEYKRSRGFYFDDIENWIPSRINKTEEQLFQFLQSILSNGIDPYEEKRQKLKSLFFTFKDAASTKRLVEHVFTVVSK